MANAITIQLEAARKEFRNLTAQIQELERLRDIAAAKVEAFELSARYIDGMQVMQGTRKGGEARAPRARTPSSDWVRMFQTLYDLYDGAPFGYDEIMEVAAMLEISVQRPSLRTKMMNYSNDSYVERVGNGEFRITDAGIAYFNLNVKTNKGSEFSEPSSNVGAVAERSNAPDSKSGGPSSPQNSTGPVGSNPTGSAPVSTAQEGSFRRELLSTTRPHFPSRETG